MAPSVKMSVSFLAIFCLSVLIISPRFNLAQAAPTQNLKSVSVSNSTQRILTGNLIEKSKLPGEERGRRFEGDMILPKIWRSRTRDHTKPKTAKRWPNAGMRDKSYRWPNAVVIYELDSNFTLKETQVIRGAMKEISDKSCVQFQQRQQEAAYVRFVRGESSSGCWSQVGFWNEVQEINLEPESQFSNTCIRHGTVVHEILHTLGFYHEQSRTDRDEFITINVENIEPEDYNTNFKKYDADTITDFNITYDYNSIMHYGAFYFAVDPSIPTIVSKKPNVKLGQRIKLSEMDAIKINAMYSGNNEECQRKFISLKSEMEKRRASEKSTAQKFIEWLRRSFG